MKKILIAILLLVPLIIIATLSVSSTIVSAEIEYGVEQLFLKHLGERQDYVVIDLDEYAPTNKSYVLFPEFIPSNASNKKIEWTLSDENMATIVKNGDGIAIYFKPGCYGTFDVIATSMSDTSQSAVCSFYVTGKYIGAMELYDYDTLDRIDSISLKVNESTCIDARPRPFSAMGDKKIVWDSSNEGVAKVNGNGVITAVSEGTCTVTATVNEDGRKPITGVLTVAVNGESLSKKSVIYTTSRTVDISNYLRSDKSGITVKSVVGGTNSGFNITVSEAVSDAYITLSHLGYEEIIKVSVVANNSLVIDNLFDYEKTVWSAQNLVPLNTELFYISASCPFADAGRITWTSDNPAVATVVGDRIAGLMEGVATLTATSEGFEPVSITIIVSPKIGDVRLELDERGDIAGLNEERLFGIYTCNYDGNEFTVSESLQMRISYVFPEYITESENIYDYFLFESNDESLATVGANGVISFTRDAIGKEVTITAIARFSENNSSDSYTFKVVDGINIGYDVAITHYDKKADTELPDFYPAYELQYVMNSYTGDFDSYGTMGAVLFQNNVYLPLAETEWTDIKLNRSIYGNGYIIDGQLHNTKFDSRVFDSSLDYDGLLKHHGNNSNINIENLYIQSYYPISEGSSEAFGELKDRGGIPIRLDDSRDPDVEISFSFKYCMFRYAYAHLNICGVPVTVDGCILSNSAAPSILHQSSKHRPSKMVIRNSIFSNTTSPVYLSVTGNALDMEETKEYKYMDLKLEGENYVYNWKKLDEITLDILANYGDDYEALMEILRVRIAEFFKLVVKDPDNSAFVEKVAGEDYMNFSFMVVGAWRNNHLEINPDTPESERGSTCNTVSFDTNDYTCYEIDMKKLQEVIDSNIIYRVACEQFNVKFLENPSYLIATKGEKGVYNTKPGETYKIDQETKDKLHGIHR